MEKEAVEREMAKAPIIPVERKDIIETEEEVEKISEIERQEKELQEMLRMKELDVFSFMSYPKPIVTPLVGVG